MAHEETIRYERDPAFRALVDIIAAYMRAHGYSILDARAAATCAAFHVAEPYLDAHPDHAPTKPPNA